MQYLESNMWSQLIYDKIMRFWKTQLKFIHEKKAIQLYFSLKPSFLGEVYAR